jgi:hypothetical protein
MPTSGVGTRRAERDAHLSVSERESRLWDWDLSDVRRRVCERLAWSPRRAKAVETEYRKFMVLALHERGTLGMAGPVDEFWHDHLDTPDYAKFCTEIFGDYVRHVPHAPGAPRDGETYRVTHGLLRRYFGRVNDRVWPSLSAAETSACNCSSCDKAPMPGEPAHAA